MESKLRLHQWAALILAVGASASCGTGTTCGLALQQRLFFPPASTNDPVGEVPCCGASVYQDVNLAADDLQVDLINSSAANARVDAFLTNADCVKLFNGPYAGTANAPLCTILIGPVSFGSASGRKAIRRGRYRIFAQAYSSNDTPAVFLMELGLWSDDCHWKPITQ